jgi:sulfopyruvate decarboxylase TPP-binding subunit
VAAGRHIENIEDLSYVLWEMGMFADREIIDIFHELQITHVVWVPDSLTGTWERALDDAEGLSLIRVCREGEAWAIAAGLFVAGKRPLVIMQMTGFFESADSMRNSLFDLQLPLLAIVGGRNMLTETVDSAKTYAIPVVDAWGIEYAVVHSEEQKPELKRHLFHALQSGKPGLVVVAEAGG